jgi:ABC-type transporter Mla subunit MlaD
MSFVEELLAAARSAPDPLSEVATQVESLSQSITRVGENLSGKQESLQTLRDQVQERLTSVQGELEQQTQAVNSAAEALGDKGEVLTEAIGAVAEGVSEALEVAQQQLDDFSTHIEAGREAVEAANETAQGVLGEIQNGINAGREALQAGSEYAFEQIDALQGTIDETLQTTEQIASSLVEGVDNGIREAGAKIEEMTGVSFADLQGGFGTAVELLQGNVFENGANMALDSLQSMIEEQLNQIIDQLLDLMVQTMGRVREGLFGSAEEAGLERKMLEPILDALQPALDPLFSAVDGLKSLAEMVGIDV